jgi:hypothetical protein
MRKLYEDLKREYEDMLRSESIKWAHVQLASALAILEEAFEDRRRGDRWGCSWWLILDAFLEELWGEVNKAIETVGDAVEAARRLEEGLKTMEKLLGWMEEAASNLAFYPSDYCKQQNGGGGGEEGGGGGV